MRLSSSPTELTTAITDAALAAECLLIAAYLRRGVVLDGWRVGQWRWVFRLMAASSLAGAAVHGLVLPAALQTVLWRALSLCLGILVPLVLIAAIYDWRGRLLAVRLIPYAILAGFAFLALSELTNRMFIVFIAYEATVTAVAMAIYLCLAVKARVKGALLVAVALLVHLAAGAVQTSGLAVSGPIQLDHNGLFHLVQMAGTAMLGLGLKRGMR